MIFKIFSSLFKSKQDKLCDLLDSLYQHINSTKTSVAERERLQLSDSTYTYGEIMPRSFSRLLELAKPKENEVFYDLGSGNGKAIFVAALLYDWKKCIGIEYLPALYETSITILNQFHQLHSLKKNFSQKSFDIKFLHCDFFEVDLSDANVIFINSTAFNVTLWEKLKLKLNHVLPGTRIITISKQLNNSCFDKINESMLLQSWGMSSAFIYRRNQNIYSV